MPRHRAAQVCATPGCINDQPCPIHTRKPWANSTRAARLPRNWQTIRRQVLTRDAHTCQACQGTACGNQRLEVDHINRGDDHSPGNLRTLGHDCHTTKTQAEALEARQRTTGAG